MKPKPHILSLGLTISVTACSAGFGFISESDNNSRAIHVEIEVDDANPDEESLIRQEFELADSQPIIDYVIVIDNSISMDPIIDRIRAGLIQAAQAQLFPANSQIAVMSTMIADFNDFTRTGQGVNRYDGIDAEPGFLDFVYDEAVHNYRQAAPQFAERWSVDACSNKWFAPEQLNPQGVPCLFAAMQTSGARVGAEAGALAFQQILEKHRGESLFRNGAHVNIIFVSDTHDPGRPDPILLALTPDFGRLNNLIQLDNEIIRLRFHALAPDEVCTSEDIYDKAYYQLAEASGGVTKDPCDSDDYSDFVLGMIEASHNENLSFRLEPPAKEVLGVRVAGRLFADFNLMDAGRLLSLNIKAEQVDGKIEVIYR